MKRYVLKKPENADIRKQLITRTIADETVTYAFADTDNNNPYNKLSNYTSDYKYLEIPESNLENYITVTSNIGVVFIYSETSEYVYLYDLFMGSNDVAFDSILDNSAIELRNKQLNKLNFHQLVCQHYTEGEKAGQLYTKLNTLFKKDNLFVGSVDMDVKSNASLDNYSDFKDKNILVRDNEIFDVFEFELKSYFTIKNVDKVELLNENMNLISLGNGSDRYYISYDYQDRNEKIARFKFYGNSDRIIEVL